MDIVGVEVYRTKLARALFEASYQADLRAWSDETRAYWLARADAALSIVSAAPDGDEKEACRFIGVSYTPADLEIAQRAACAIVPFYGTGDVGEQEDARLGKLWNDHPAVQGALRALHEVRKQQGYAPNAALTTALASPVPGWRTIESAPKDGTPVHLLNDRGQFIAVWDDKFFDVEGWWVCLDGKHDDRPLRGSEPTHWMPLPAAPSEDKPC